MFKTTFHREFVNPGGNTEEHMFHHNLARTHHPRGYYKMTHTGNWIDRSSWFAIQVGVGAEATPTTVATHLHACFEEAVRLKYVHSAPHFDMPQWSVPRLDGFFNVERAEFWKVSAALHAKKQLAQHFLTVTPIFRHSRHLTFTFAANWSPIRSKYASSTIELSRGTRRPTTCSSSETLAGGICQPSATSARGPRTRPTQGDWRS